jgi:hypothetical protein
MLRALLLLLAIAGCGGRARQHAPLPQESAGEGGVAEGGRGEPTPGGPGPGGETASGGAGLASGAAGQAGATPEEPPPLIGSGARYCESELYCFGFQCYAPEHLYDRVCVSECASSADCGEQEACLESPDLRGTCYRICEQVSDCSYGFDCFDFSAQHEQLVCFPTKWAEYWRTHAR